MLRLHYFLCLCFITLIVISSLGPCNALPAAHTTSKVKSPSKLGKPVNSPKSSVQPSKPNTSSSLPKLATTTPSSSKSKSSPSKTGIPSSTTPPKSKQSFQNTQQCSESKKTVPRSLFGRTNYSPVPATGSITLYHGTPSMKAALLKANGPLLSKTAKQGDFSRNYGFYLTDRMRAAGQFVCNPADVVPGLEPKSVTIFEYSWAGISANKIHAFTGETDDWREFCCANLAVDDTPDVQKVINNIAEGKVMITGPMRMAGADDKLTPDFWQYTVTDQNTLSKNLKLVAEHSNIPCTEFPAGQFTDPADSQGPSADFSSAVKTALQINPLSYDKSKSDGGAYNEDGTVTTNLNDPVSNNTYALQYISLKSLLSLHLHCSRRDLLKMHFDGTHIISQGNSESSLYMQQPNRQLGLPRTQNRDILRDR
ncbi:hypothetical protein GYMLUDRAFT_238946 [Collybiopsis luxurians FD-317 M1]|nr:hypothetical protein GYMLUDRAFT_238946 [Collybiopsis luxurians FD-317 M1]